jgi:predicted DNA-binding WGR domain protein
MYHLARWQSRRFEKGARYYVAEVRQDLFGGWELARHWGRKASALGGGRALPYPAQADALAQLAAVAKRRASRGYHETTP